LKNSVPCCVIESRVSNSRVINVRVSGINFRSDVICILSIEKRSSKELDHFYTKPGFQFLVVYGRRRVGKTVLLMEFCKDKPCIFYTTKEASEKDVLENFSQSIFSFYGFEGLASFNSWEQAFLFLSERAKSKSTVLVLDEFPYMVNSSKSLPSVLQNLIDRQLGNSQLFLIICGLSMSFIEKEVLSYKSPLYGRRSGQLEVQPFDFFEARKFFPNYSFEDQLAAYGILGGIPQYLKTFNDRESIYENIRSQILNKTSFLYEEPIFLLRQELREPSTYNSIIEAIATGSTKLNQISTKVGIENDKCAKYLASLIELRIVKKIYPVTKKENRRNSLYKLNDNFFRFWYRFVFPNRSLIEMEKVEKVVEEKIKPYFSTYMGYTFEQVCKIGKWLGK